MNRKRELEEGEEDGARGEMDGRGRVNDKRWSTENKCL